MCWLFFLVCSIALSGVSRREEMDDGNLTGFR